jgi:uncharacterized NAD-dependent epimerase/dehydratase family protein
MLPLSTLRVAVLLHDGIDGSQGKTGMAFIRFCPGAIAVVIDAETAGQSLRDLTGLACDAPIVASVQEALTFHPEVLLIGIAPSGGVLPDPWFQEVKRAVAAGLSVANGLHTRLADHPDLNALIQDLQDLQDLQPKPILWDIRQEPIGLSVGTAAARSLTCQRVLTVGTDMGIGKMSTSLALDRACRERGLRSAFVGTGQAGIMIAGSGVALDAVRVDFASGAVEQAVMNAGHTADILHIEGQGSLLHPSSTATLPLIRGSQPTQLVLVHCAGQTHIRNYPDIPIPPLSQVVQLYEAVAAAAGAYAPVRVTGIALNTYHLDDRAARDAIDRTEQETGISCTDSLRFSPISLLRLDR